MLHCGVPPRAFRRKRITSDTVEMRAVINRALEAESLGTSPETTNSVTCYPGKPPNCCFSVVSELACELLYQHCQGRIRDLTLPDATPWKGKRPASLKSSP